MVAYPSPAMGSVVFETRKILVDLRHGLVDGILQPQ